jgi:hypothetical protein
MWSGREVRVPEDVVDQRQKGAESLDGSLEHMFVIVDGGADGARGRNRGLTNRGRTGDPRDPQGA